MTRLLDFALIEEGQRRYTFEPVDLCAAARDAAASCREIAGANRIRLVEQSSELWVEGDRTALTQAIQNLVDNALKYSPADTDVRIESGFDAAGPFVAVEDRGIGIPSNERSRIFEKFYRGDHVRTLNVEGVGIGLALVRHVAERHGGSITVEDAPTGGSRFVLRLPGMPA